MYGNVKNEAGLIFSKENKFRLIKKFIPKGEAIPSHNHEEALVLFTVIKGKAVVSLNNEEKHTLKSGDILHFDGNNFISAIASGECEISVTLIDK